MTTDSRTWMRSVSASVTVAYTFVQGERYVSSSPCDLRDNLLNVKDDQDGAFAGEGTTIAVPPPDRPFSIRVRVMDEDGWFTGGDDQLGDDTFFFDVADDFGATGTTHVRDLGNYRITFTIAKNP